MWRTGGPRVHQGGPRRAIVLAYVKSAVAVLHGTFSAHAVAQMVDILTTYTL
jgi:hypothetical protein